MRKPKLIKDLFPNYEGLFTKFNFDFGVTKSLLDIMFIGQYGYKNPSPFIEAIHDEDEPKMTSQELLTTASAIYSLYSNKWERLKGLAELDYDPIHNYLDEWSDQNQGSDSRNGTVSSTRTDTLNTTETTNSTTSNSEADSIHGFNSLTAVPTDGSTGSGTVAETVTNTGTIIRGFTQSDSETGSDLRNRSGSHSGNIGNITSQKMINEEIQLWKWNFINEVLSDVAEFCCLPIYLKWRL